MKTKIVQRVAGLALIGLLALFPAACTSAGAPAGGNSGPGKGAGEYVSLVRTRSVFLYPDTPDTSPKLEIALSMLESSKKNRQFIMDILYDGLGTEAYAEKRLFGYDKMYEAMQFVVERIPDMSMLPLNWYYNEAFVYHAGNSKLAVISREWEYYTGGAHGMRNKDYYVFGLDSKRRLALSDIVREDARPALGVLIEAALRKRMEIPDQTPLTEQGFVENYLDKLEDFYLIPQGLGFQWDPYEIAPYSMGIIEILIPYDEAQGMLTVLGLALIKNIR